MSNNEFIPSGLKIGEGKLFDTHDEAKAFIKDAKSVEHFYIDQRITSKGERWYVQRYDAAREHYENNQDRYL